jgi:hypothetical protein
MLILILNLIQYQDDDALIVSELLPASLHIVWEFCFLL